MEVDRQLLEPRPDASELLEPADALFDDAPPAVRHAVEPDGRVVPRRLVVLVRDHRLDPLGRDPVAHARHAVRLVAGELPGFVPALCASCVVVRSGTRPPGRSPTRPASTRGPARP